MIEKIYRSPAVLPGALARPAVRLRCPCCGQTRLLHEAGEWPPALLQIVALCPDCSGHGQDSALLMFADGRIVAEHPPAR